MPELVLIADADERASNYVAGTAAHPSFLLRMLDIHGSPATTVSNGPRYFGFVIGARVARLLFQCPSRYRRPIEMKYVGF